MKITIVTKKISVKTIKKLEQLGFIVTTHVGGK